MPRCPHCAFESHIMSAYCPACGGALETAIPENQPQEEPAIPSAPAAMPLGMKWLRFLVMFLLPMNIAGGILSLTGLNLAEFVPPSLPSFAKGLLYSSLVVSCLQIPLLAFAMIGMLRLRWKGVQALLFNYLLTAAFSLIYAAALVVLSIREAMLAEATLMAIIEMLTSAGAMIAMFFINRVYFHKRRGFFLPEKM